MHATSLSVALRRGGRAPAEANFSLACMIAEFGSQAEMDEAANTGAVTAPGGFFVR
jgi:hypothetical protein